ncbi:CaiB/BaiF CoA-transferase family protein [Epidermidibacterium keratini]|nr:CaiB/BaiF CoA-transferase family protein [Epidermidibacterium keratini]
MTQMLQLPLEGVTVVAIEQAVAAPFCTRQLADMGARVIKVERPGPGDFARDYDHVAEGQSSHFVWLNRSKESIALDLKSAAGREALGRLIETADVFVQNLAPGAAERLGVDAATLRAERPELIHVSISGYGPGGPYSAKRAYDLLVQCEAGLLSVTGTPQEMVKAGFSAADVAAGMYAYSNVLAAIIRRDRQGVGATIEISMLEALVEWMGFPMYFAHYAGAAPARTGAEHPAIAPYGPFRAGDGARVFLGIQNDREWVRFAADVLQRPELGADPLFATNPARVSNKAQLNVEIESVFARLDADEIIARLEAAGIANARLRTMDEVVSHPQLQARDRWREVGSPGGPLIALRPPASLDGPEAPMADIPAVGQHTEAILAELGLAAPESAVQNRTE